MLLLSLAMLLDIMAKENLQSASGSAGTATVPRSAFHSQKRAFENSEIITGLQAPSVKCIKGPIAQGSSLYLTKILQNPNW